MSGGGLRCHGKIERKRAMNNRESENQAIGKEGRRGREKNDRYESIEI